jgi:hypothetical protein
MQRAVAIISWVTLTCLCLFFATMGTAQDGSASQHFTFTESNLHLVQSYGINYPQTTEDITSASGAPLAGSVSGGLGSISLPGGTELWYYIDSAGHIIEIHCCGFTWGDLSALTGAPVALATSALTAYNDSLGLHVAYEGTNQHIIWLYYQYSKSSWSATDLTAATGGALAVSGTPLSGFADVAGQYISYIATNQDVYFFYLDYGKTWGNQNISAAAGAGAALSGSALMSYADNIGKRYFYEAGNEHIVQLLLTTAWSHLDVTLVAGASPALANTALTGFYDKANSVYGSGGDHVFYYGSNLELTELLSTNGSSWTVQTVPQGTDSSPAKLASLPGYQDSSGTVDYEQVAAVIALGQAPCNTTTLVINQNGQPNIPPPAWALFCPAGAQPSLQSSLTGFINP